MDLELAYKKLAVSSKTVSQVTLCGRGVQVDVKATSVTLVLYSLLPPVSVSPSLVLN